MAKVGIIGFGAIGASMGAYLLSKGQAIKVLVDEDRKARYMKDGVIVNGQVYKDYDVISALDASAQLDILLVAVKYNHLGEVVPLIQQHIHPKTVIISLMNGIDSEQRLAESFSTHQIVHAFVVGIDALRIGNEVTYTHLGKVIMGPGFPEAQDNEESIKRFCDPLDFPYEWTDNIINEQWWKFLVNVGVNQTSAVLQANYGVFKHNQEARQLMIDTMQEVIDVSKAEGVHLTYQAIERFLEVLESLGSEMKTSMLQDIEAKRQTEVDMLAGKVIELGKKHGIKTPINEVLYQMIKAKEYMNQL